MSTTFDILLEEAELEAQLAESNTTSYNLADSLVEGVEDLFDEDQFGEFAPKFDPAIDQYQFFNQSYTPMDDDELESHYNPDVSLELNNEDNHVAEGAEDGSDEFRPNYISTIIPVDEVIFEQQNIDDEEAELEAGLSSDSEDDDEDFTEGK